VFVTGWPPLRAGTAWRAGVCSRPDRAGSRRPSCSLHDSGGVRDLQYGPVRRTESTASAERGKGRGQRPKRQRPGLMPIRGVPSTRSGRRTIRFGRVEERRAKVSRAWSVWRNCSSMCSTGGWTIGKPPHLCRKTASRTVVVEIGDFLSASGRGSIGSLSNRGRGGLPAKNPITQANMSTSMVPKICRLGTNNKINPITYKDDAMILTIGRDRFAIAYSIERKSRL
jgi:hypothetical protein